MKQNITLVRKRQYSDLNNFVFIRRQLPMHNLVSFNNLRSWTEESDPVDDYFECITMCDVNDKSCHTECRTLLE